MSHNASIQPNFLLLSLRLKVTYLKFKECLKRIYLFNILKTRKWLKKLKLKAKIHYIIFIRYERDIMNNSLKQYLPFYFVKHKDMICLCCTKFLNTILILYIYGYFITIEIFEQCITTSFIILNEKSQGI